MEIASPGGFPEDVRLDNLLVTAPHPRNPVLADAFKRIGLVERTGRGIDTIYEGQLRYGRPAPDYSRSSAGSVQVVLPGGEADVGLARLIMEHDTPARRMTLEEMLIINTVTRERRIDLPRVAALVQRSESGARAILDRLVDADVLDETEERRSPVYTLSAAASRILGQGGAEHVEPARREEAILEYVDRNGRITRSQAADLCQLEAREARAILEKLVKRGDLVIRGERRGSYYERSAGVMTGRS
jgi:ATP-dependent DNA helicase RecG